VTTAQLKLCEITGRESYNGVKYGLECNGCCWRQTFPTLNIRQNFNGENITLKPMLSENNKPLKSLASWTDGNVK
jgi:hypothetical protein